jgi:hypothetical protein
MDDVVDDDEQEQPDEEDIKHTYTSSRRDDAGPA